MLDIEALIRRLPERSADAALSISGFGSRALRRHLTETLGASAGTPGSLVADPVLEGAYPWRPHPGGWDNLPADFHPTTAAALKAAMGYAPYAHQVEAWAHLCRQEPSSAIISSGTGSGKTECFLGAMLDHLLRASEGGQKRLTGVRALMIYPLNALISSQEERLTTWFAPYSGKLRYCLYNGLTPEKPELRQAALQQSPQQVYDRKTLRQDPPPVLVTNISMLEYMLVRTQDAPILAASQGLLEYIVLDEAHTYVGAAAAELALLLRRVALAFGRDPDTIRVVATSATLGTGDRQEQSRQLSEFLEGLAGSRPEAVRAILGERAALRLPAPAASSELTLADLEGLDDQALWERLSAVEAVQSVVRTLHSGQRIPWAEWRRLTREQFRTDSSSNSAAQRLLTLCARARGPDGQLLLPVRLHFFQKAPAGLWACCDPRCSGKFNDDDENWRFGKVFGEARENCDSCTSPVFEIYACSSCGLEALWAEEVESDGDYRLKQPIAEIIEDDFTLEREEPDEEVDDGGAVEAPTTITPSLHQWIMPGPGPGRFPRPIDRSNARLLSAEVEGSLVLHCSDDQIDRSCPACRHTLKKQAALRPFRIGAPFSLGTTIPVALAAAGAEAGQARKPFSGRKLITFTDARQGTARLAARLQGDAERAFVRAFIYHTVQSRPACGTMQEIEEKQRQLTALQSIQNVDLATMITGVQAELDVLKGIGNQPPLPWTDITDRISQDATTTQLRSLWREREELFERDGEFAHFLLLRELLRRPRRANSAETMGLVRLILPRHESPEPPPSANALGFSQEDWRDLLRLLLTYFLRSNSIVSVAPSAFNWIDRRPTHRAVGQFEQSDAVTNPWPAVRHPRRSAEVIRLIAQACELTLDDREARGAINELLDDARVRLAPYCEQVEGGGMRLDMRRLALANVSDAWICPVTQRVVDTTFRGLSPYARAGVFLPALAIRMPALPIAFPNTASRDVASTIESFLATDEDVATLRELGVWSNLHSRAVAFDPYFRSAEHSAQQPPKRLRAYEEAFKAGDINVLNCSTTMEMGVDIGSMELVVNTNTPPSIASYRQRVGRAGRRDQPIAAAVTLCKDRPLDRRAFRDPMEYLDGKLRAPQVSLDSVVIARRHAHALLLAAYLQSRGENALKSQVGTFFGFEMAPEIVAPWLGFLAWLDETEARLESEGPKLKALLEGTRVGADRTLLESARDEITRIADQRRDEWFTLVAQSEACATDRAASGAINAQKKRVAGCHLLRELANDGFLPNHGFATGVVPFVTDKAGDKDRSSSTWRNDDRSRSRDYPSRQLDIAMFEYAPGATVVLDGLVYEAGGLTLNWKAPASEANLREIQALNTAWRCRRCAAAGVTSTVIRPDQCVQCGSAMLDYQDHIAPAGFAVDLRGRPHDDTEDVLYVARKAPWVHASDGTWVALPFGGRVRASDGGLVYASNEGPKGYGYAICLQCGRAAHETQPLAAATPLPGPLDNGAGGHSPLRGSPRAEDGFCPGRAGTFSIKRNLGLGAAKRTAVVEIQLYDCPDADTARAIAAALRESCALELGIEPEQMGFIATEAPTDDGSEAWCAVVYDRASGGAGFAPTIADNPVKHLWNARDLLDCSAAGRCKDQDAVRFCAKCLLSSDVQQVFDRCDRRTAYRVLSQLAPNLSVGLDDQLLGPETRVESSVLGQTLSRRLERRQGECLAVWLNGEPSSWDLNQWPARRVCETWGPRGVPIKIVADPQAINRADIASRQALLRLVQRCQQAELVSPALALPGKPLAALVAESGIAQVWATRDEIAATTGSDWGASGRAPIVHGSVAGNLFGGAIDLEALSNVPSGTAVVDVMREADGTVRGFGKRLRSFLEREDRGLIKAVLGNKVGRIFYSDRYLFSPLSGALASELIAAFAELGTEVHMRTWPRKKSAVERDHSPWQVQHDWISLTERKEALEALLAPPSGILNLEFTDDVPHRRKLIVLGEHGELEITLDQGVGAWRTADTVRFDFSAHPERQVQRLRSDPIRVRNDPGGTFVVLRRI